MSSGWLDCTEPSPTYSFQGIEIVRHQTSSNPIELDVYRDSKVYRLLSHKFRMVQLDHTNSGWFDMTEPFLTASLQAIEGVRVLYALVG